MNRLRLVHTESSCGWGGQELRVLNEAAGMARMGHDVLIAAPPESRIYGEAQRRHIATCALPIARKSFAGWRAMRGFLRERAPQVVNTHSSTDSWLVTLACLGLKNAPAIVRTRHISAPIPDNAGSRWLYGRAAHVVTTGEALRLQVIEQTRVSPSLVTSVPTGVDLTRFQPGDPAVARATLGLAPDDFLVGIVATLRSWKGHRYLLDALHQIDDVRVKVVIVGGGPGEIPLQQQTQALGLAKRVVMAGQRDDVLPWLQSLDVFALPSYANEGVPQAIMQAMACGLPVITTSIGAIGEVARDNATALIVEPRNAAAIAAAILRLRDDDGMRRRLGEAGQVDAKSRFSEGRMLDAMEHIFVAVAAGRLA